MKTEIDTLWVFALASRCRVDTFAWPWLVLLIGLAWLAMALIYWAHPGGPAWGYFRFRHHQHRKAIIPGPRGLPFVGSMGLMASLAHRRLAAAASSLGAKRLMAFSLGETRAVVTCHPDVAKEILNSAAFADRPVKESAYKLMFNRAIGFAPYGVYWRTLRRIAANHLFCPKQIKSSENQRRQIADQMVQNLIKNSTSSFSVRGILKRASLNNMMWSVFGRVYGIEETINEVEEVRGLVEEGYELLGVLNWSDHLPWAAEFDAQRIGFRCSRLVPKVNRFVGGIVAEHHQKNGGSGKDFVDVLLSLNGPDKLSDSDMIAVLWVIKTTRYICFIYYYFHTIFSTNNTYYVKKILEYGRNRFACFFY